MPKISLTEFVDYAIKAGTAKLTCVRKIKKSHDLGYRPSKDFYRRIRDGIVGMHQAGVAKSCLDQILDGSLDQARRKNYPPLIAGYKQFLGRKKPEWFDPPRAEWAHGDLAVRINPELGLNLKGQPHLIKLYFKGARAPLTKRRIDLINYLMLSTLKADGDGMAVGMLDVLNGKLLIADSCDPNINPLLNGEALAFSEMYRLI